MAPVERGRRGRIDALAHARRQRGEVDREIALRVGHDPALARDVRRRARARVRAEQRGVPFRRRRIPRYERGARPAGKAFGKGAQLRGDDRRLGDDRRRQRVRISLRHLGRKPDDIRPLGGDQPRQIGLAVLALHRQRQLRALRHRFRYGAQNAKRQRQAARTRVLGAGDDDVQPLFRRQPAQGNDAGDAPGCREQRFGMRQHRYRQPRKVARNAPLDIVRGREHALGAAQQRTECGPPCADIQRPVRRAHRDAGSAPFGVGLAAIPPVHGDQMVLRADRIVVVQRAVVRDT